MGELGYGIAHTSPQRIAERGQPDELELGLGVGGVARDGGDTTLGDRNDPEPVLREPGDLREHRRPLCLGHRGRIEDGLGGSLHGHPRPAGIAPYRAFAPAHGIERVAGEALARRGLTGRLGQRAIDRILRGRCTVGGRRRGKHALAVAVDAFDQQAVLGQRPGFVGEQHGHRADGLRGAQAPQQDAVLREAQTAQRDEHGHEDRQLLGDRGERERQPVEQHLAGRPALEDPDERHQHARGDRNDQCCARQLCHRALEGSGRFLGLCDEPAQTPDLGLVTQRDDHALPGAGQYGRARVQHRGPLGERRVGVDRLGPLRGRDGLTGQPGLVRSEAVGLHDAGVGRDDAAGFDEQDVPDDECADRDRHRDPCAPDERVGGAEFAQRLQRTLRADLGDRLDCTDEDDDREDRDRVAKFAEDRRKHADHDQQQLERLHHRLDDLAQDAGGLATFGSARRGGALRDLLGPSARRAGWRCTPTRPPAVVRGPGPPAHDRRVTTRTLRSS